MEPTNSLAKGVLIPNSTADASPKTTPRFKRFPNGAASSVGKLPRAGYCPVKFAATKLAGAVKNM